MIRAVNLGETRRKVFRYVSMTCPGNLTPSSIPAFRFKQALVTLKMGWCSIGGKGGAISVSDMIMYNGTMKARPHRPGPRQICWRALNLHLFPAAAYRHSLGPF